MVLRFVLVKPWNSAKKEWGVGRKTYTRTHTRTRTHAYAEKSREVHERIQHNVYNCRIYSDIHICDQVINDAFNPGYGKVEPLSIAFSFYLSGLSRVGWERMVVVMVMVVMETQW